MVEEFGARGVLDIGCGTGVFACLLAARGIAVTGVDPAAASLDVARGKAGADRVRWILGDATRLPAMQVDLATMTANVAQVFLADEDWAATLHGARAALRPGGRLVFETRDLARQAWLGWNPAATGRRTQIPGVGIVGSWTELGDIGPAGNGGLLVSFRQCCRFESDGVTMTSDSTLRFRTHGELEESLRSAGFAVDDVRDAPDRPGLEWVYVARAG